MTKQEIFDKIATLLRTQTEVVSGAYREMSGLCSPVGCLVECDQWLADWNNVGVRQLLDDVPEYYRLFLDPEETVDERWDTTRMICELQYAFEECGFETTGKRENMRTSSVAEMLAAREGYLRLIAATRGCEYHAPV